jgi:xanthine/uracil/vitamin C permease (AzgA family)
MRDVIVHLNYVHVLVVTVAGFVLGCLWSHGPLFGKQWMAEMKFTKESMEAAMKQQGMAMFLIKGLTFTLLSTFGLAALIAAHGSSNWKHGVAFGMFVGLFGPGVRLLNGACWENRSVKLQAINFGHEVAIYALQGAILGAWH